MHILYLTYDLTDPASHKRGRMLRAGGATVHIAGFRRGAETATHIEGCAATDFGRTYNGRFLQRIGATIREVFLVHRHRALFAKADVIIARNLEMLAIAVRGRSLCKTPPTLVYESLDIHRLLLREDMIGNTLRALEGWLSRRAVALITSSPAFVSEYFEKRSRVRLPIILLENKVFEGGENNGEIAANISPTPDQKGRALAAPPWRIGWFGAIRCKKSFYTLCELAHEYPNLVEVVIRGRVSYDQISDFDARVRNTPGVRFLDSYKNPDDLAAIYGDVHFSWAIDRFEEGLNSAWLLPNRMYESGLYGAVPLAQSGVETGNLLARLGIGHLLATANVEELANFLQSLTPKKYRAMHEAVSTVPRETWVCNRAECVALVEKLRTLTTTNTKPARIIESSGHLIIGSSPVLVVIPCLNEAKNIEALVEYLVGESAATPMTIVIADGGSSDGTVDIAKRLAEKHAAVRYLHNPKRIQSAAVNLAFATYSKDYDHLIRMDAHAAYPPGYCRALLEEAIATGADSVVVSIHTVGRSGFPKAVAAAQNSKLGNGGSAHRSAHDEGRFVEHGHHALMRIAAYRAVGGYDENFTHNEDAELDVRLRRAGFRIWLTRKTTLDYFPRATPRALFCQYYNYGRGRAHNLLKHRTRPRLRQMMPVMVAPAAALLLLSPLFPLAALPIFAWVFLCLSYGGWLAYAARRPLIFLSGPAAMLMHSGWSLGFWQGVVTHRTEPRA